MGKKINFLKIFFLLIFLFLFLPQRLNSQVSFSISPQKLDLVLFPGSQYEGKFKITNHSSLSIPISIKIVPFGAKEETGEMEFEKIEHNSPIFWFSFENSEMILLPKETKRINFQIKIPKETKPGGYYVFVYFEPRFPKEYFENAGPKIIPVIGVPVLISTSEILIEPEKGKEIEVLNFSIAQKERMKIFEDSFKFLYEKTKISLISIGTAMAAQNPEIFITKSIPETFFVQIKNNDIYHLKPYGKIEIFDIFGKKIGEGNLKGETILPQKTRTFEVKISQKEKFSLGQILSFIFLGKTKAKLEIKAQSPVRGEISPIQKEISLSFFSLKSFYSFLFFVIIILIGNFAKKRICLAFKVLIEKQ